MRFPECRVRFPYMLDMRRLRELLAFVGWGFIGPLGMMLRGQGAMVLVNRMFNPAVNASWALARTVSDKSNTLAESIKGAMVPAIVQACGAGDTARMHALVSRMCKFSLAATLLVATPLLLELPDPFIDRPEGRCDNIQSQPDGILHKESHAASEKG